MKINTDASFDTNTCTGSAGVVIRDHSGMVRAAAERWFEDVPDALTAEALAAKEGLELALEIGYDSVILEVDCQCLRTLLKDPASMRSSIGGLCLDIKELGRSFIDFRVEWVFREANSVAHYCAYMVLATERSFWLDYVPDWLTGLSAADCTPVLN
jgi:ribonuclease HI